MASGKVVIVSGASFIVLEHTGLHFVRWDAVLLFCAVDPVSYGRMDKNTQTVFLITQHIIGAPAHDHAGPFGCDALDRISFRDKNLIRYRQIPGC